MQKRIFGNVTFAFSAYIIDEVKQVTNNEKVTMFAVGNTNKPIGDSS